MEVSLTELRQRLFELADRVIETGEAIVITRRGRTLRIVRDEVRPRAFSRLARLRELGPQELEIGPPLDPHESPAQWSELEEGAAEDLASYAVKPAARSTRRPSPAKPKKRAR
jgi:prevent-host-death family protein